VMEHLNIDRETLARFSRTRPDVVPV
jgi:hypothetical protein